MESLTVNVPCTGCVKEFAINETNVNEHTFENVNGGNWFCGKDCAHAYFQNKIDELVPKIKELKRLRRLTMGKESLGEVKAVDPITKDVDTRNINNHNKRNMHAGTKARTILLSELNTNTTIIINEIATKHPEINNSNLYRHANHLVEEFPTCIERISDTTRKGNHRGIRLKCEREEMDQSLKNAIDKAVEYEGILNE